MIDPKVLRDDPDRVRAAQAKRGLSDEVVDRALAADAARRAAIADVRGQAGASRSSSASRSPQAQGDEKAALLARTKELAAEVKAAEAAQTEAEEAWRAALMEIPNLAAEETPAGGEDDFVVLETVGTPPRVRLRAPRPRRARPDARRDRHRARRQGVRLALLLPHRCRRPARVRADQHGAWTRRATPASPR